MFAHSAGKWYFRTREGVDVGPYDTPFEAEIEAGLLKELLKKCDSDCTRTVRSWVDRTVDFERVTHVTRTDARIRFVSARPL